MTTTTTKKKKKRPHQDEDEREDERGGVVTGSREDGERYCRRRRQQQRLQQRQRAGSNGRWLLSSSFSRITTTTTTTAAIAFPTFFFAIMTTLSLLMFSSERRHLEILTTTTTTIAAQRQQQQQLDLQRQGGQQQRVLQQQGVQRQSESALERLLFEYRGGGGKNASTSSNAANAAIAAAATAATAATSSGSPAAAASPLLVFPPLSSLVDETTNEVIGDVQPLLDFAIVGFGKCGTTTLLEKLRQHSQVRALQSEVYALVARDPARLVSRLYRKLVTVDDEVEVVDDDQHDENPSSNSNSTTASSNKAKAKVLLRGYKCPGDINQRHVLEYYRTMWPRTKLLVGIRHPVDWFVSLYNFRVQNLQTWRQMPHPNSLIGKCFASSKMTCTSKGNFASSLFYLGKQYPNDPISNNNSNNGTTTSPRTLTELEKQILGSSTALNNKKKKERNRNRNRRRRNRRQSEEQGEYDSEEYDADATGESSSILDVPRLPNPVFLYDVSQLSRPEFWNDVREFLGLDDDTAAEQQRQSSESSSSNATSTSSSNERAPGAAAKVLRVSPGRRTGWNDTEQFGKDSKKIRDVCSREYLPLRRELMKLSRRTSLWIRQSGFLEAPDVSVSSLAYLRDVVLAKEWMRDPCGTEDDSDLASEEEIQRILQETKERATKG